MPPPRCQPLNGGPFIADSGFGITASVLIGTLTCIVRRGSKPLASWHPTPSHRRMTAEYLPTITAQVSLHQHFRHI